MEIYMYSPYMYKYMYRSYICISVYIINVYKQYMYDI